MRGNISRSDIRDRDGKALMVPNALPEWAILNLAGAGDTDSEVGGDTAFQVSKVGVGDATVEFQFCDSVWLMGGSLMFSGALLGDYVDFKVYAPASTIVANGGSAGNCNSVPTGLGFNIIVPAVGDGAYDVDLESRDAVIVPNAAKTGFWDWDAPRTGLGTVSPNYTQTGAYDLYPIGMNLSRFTTKIPLLGTAAMDLGIENVRPKMIPPHWKWCVTLHSDTQSNNTEATFYIVSGRARTFINPVIT